MKQFRLISILLALAVLMGLSACSDDDDKREIREYQLTVASTKQYMFYPEQYSPYFVKYMGENEWKGFQYISGLAHEEGYEYVVKVRVEKVFPDDIQDISPYVATLLEVVSKVKMDSENIPMQGGFLVIASKKTRDDSKPFYAKNNAMDQWTKIPSIEGFQHEDGYEYLIFVNCAYNGFSAEEQYSYTLVKLENKTQKESTGLPI